MCLLGVSTFRPQFNPSQTQRSSFWVGFLSFLLFLEFVPRITPLQIEIESWNLLCIFIKSLKSAFWGSQRFWVKIQLCPNLGEGMLRSRKRKNFPFLSHSIENQKLYALYKNQPPKSIRRRDMGIFPPLWPFKTVLAVPPLSPLQIELRSWN